MYKVMKLCNHEDFATYLESNMLCKTLLQSITQMISF